MTSLHGRTIHIAGAGALGLSIAVELAEAGAAVTVHDPAPATSASAAAAGMLAPAFEAVLDPVSAGHYPLLLAARDLWPAFAKRIGVKLDRGGATYSGTRAVEIRLALARLGVPTELRPEGLFTPEDWRLDPTAALERLRITGAALGVTFSEASVDSLKDGVDTIAATGWKAITWAPESLVISAIKGQILQTVFGPLLKRRGGPVERRDGAYIAPGAKGAMIGATMQPGLTDLKPDEAINDLVQGPFPTLFDHGYGANVRVGIRGATPDGLPLVGPSVAPGVWLAMGARRNGWLLAPLVAQMTLHYLAGEDPGPWASAMNARRFTAP
jgi:glycine oxidase